jgi:hypothetical protein
LVRATSSETYSDLLGRLKGARLVEVAFHAMGVKLTFCSEAKTLTLESHGVPFASEDSESFEAAMSGLSRLLYPLIDHDLVRAEWIRPGCMTLTFDNDVTVFLHDREGLAVDYAFSIRVSDENGIALLE